ncbi:MAG TPA: nucleotidyltransferase family protein [Vicinamibacterales bacterium]|nr:nucleotidyltransferase family protein [Vicinamibacterales bacterium]
MQVRSDAGAHGDLDRWLAAALLGAPSVPPERGSAEAVVEAAGRHGVLPLLAASPAAPGLGAGLHARLVTRARLAAAADLVREHELRRVLAALDAAGVQPLLLKGAGLAYSHYARPDLRPRLDSDLLIPVAARARATEVLQAAGYALLPHVTGDLLMYQASFVTPAAGAPLHVVDLHWRIANPQAFGRVLEYEELAAAAEPLPALSPSARGLGRVHALMLACVHRVAHHGDAPLLIWLYDIHLVAASMTAEAWREFAALATARGVGAVCRRSLELSVDLFGTAVPASVLASSALGGADADRSPAAGYLHQPRRVAGVWWDFRLLPSWRDRARLARQHAFPPVRYMRDVYAPASGAPLAVLYARRAWRGARKWLGRQ